MDSFDQGREAVSLPWILSKEKTGGGKTRGRDTAWQVGGGSREGRVVSGLRWWQ